MSVVTYTPNPAIDAWAACETVVPTEKTRVGEVRYDPGGGGINVARVLHAFGAPAHAVYLAGGRTGPVFDDLIRATGVACTRIGIAGDTRISQVVLERSTGREFRFVAEGPVVTPEEEEAALAALDRLAGAWVVASGSLPRGLPADHYARVAQTARNRGARFALDTAGDALAAAVEAGGIDLLKASRGELGALVGARLDTPAAVAEAASGLLARGAAERVLVSLGGEGAILVSPGGVAACPAPPLTVKGTVGAGDSFLAGFLHGLGCGLGGDDALGLAVATGSAACLRPGTQLALPEDVRRFTARAPALARLMAEPRSEPAPAPAAAAPPPGPYALPGSAPPAFAPHAAAWNAALRGDAVLPFADDLDPSAWPDPAAVALVAVQTNPLRLRLEHVGARWSGSFGRALEGRFLDDVAGRGPLAGLEDQCREAIASRRPVLQAAQTGPARLVLPWWGDGRVARLSMVLGPGA